MSPEELETERKICKLRQAIGKHRGDCLACAYDASMRGPACGHSACSQNYIDTGDTACGGCESCGNPPDLCLCDDDEAAVTRTATEKIANYLKARMGAPVCVPCPECDDEGPHDTNGDAYDTPCASCAKCGECFEVKP